MDKFTCDIKKKKFKWQGKGSNIYISDNGKYIIKDTTDEDEVLITKFLDQTLKTSPFNIFFNTSIAILPCKNSHYIISNLHVGSIFYLKNLQKQELKNITFQILASCLYLNHVLNQFHNDLHLKNILFVHNKVKKIIKTKIQSIPVNIIVDKYLIKIIDFSYMNPSIRIINLNHKPRNKIGNSFMCFKDIDQRLSKKSEALSILYCILYNFGNKKGLNKKLSHLSEFIEKVVGTDSLFKHDLLLYKYAEQHFDDLLES